MPTPRFFQLAPPKQTLIYQALLQEFATHPYEEASTNRIVKQANIAKGSLFNYFKDKEDLYLYTLQRAHLQLVEPLKKTAAPFLKESDLLICFQGWAAAQLKVLHTAPLTHDLFMHFKQAPLHLKHRYRDENADTFRTVQKECFAQVDTTVPNQDLTTSLRILMWGYQGIQAEIALFSAPVSRLLPQERAQREAKLMAEVQLLCDSIRHGLYHTDPLS